MVRNFSRIKRAGPIPIIATNGWAKNVYVILRPSALITAPLPHRLFLKNLN